MIWRTQARLDHPITKTVRGVRRQSSRGQGRRRLCLPMLWWQEVECRELEVAPRHLAGSGAAVQASTTIAGIAGAPGLAWPMMRAEG